MSIFVAIAVSVATGVPLTSQLVFAISCIYENFKFMLIIFFPMAVITVAEAKISVQRIQQFLLHYEKKTKNVVGNKKNKFINGCVLKFQRNLDKKAPEVSLKNLTARWDADLSSDVLSDVTFEARFGELVGVIGAAGSGKSTLLQVVLKELEVTKGNLDVEGTISYASQDPWIFSASIKQNILFGHEWDADKYQEVIEVCALGYDLSLLPYGDQTLVGEKGVMLSGGQKARVNLARAVYRDAEIYLLDDPLSAVDAHVARHIFERCISGYLKGKCVVLATHQFQYLQSADRVYYLESGKIFEKQDFLGLREKLVDDNKDVTKATPLPKHDLPCQVKEHRSTGTSDMKIYKSYCSAAGHWLRTCWVIFLFVFAQIVSSFSDYFVTFWVNLEETSSDSHPPYWNFFTTNRCLLIYAALMILVALTSHIASLVFASYCMRASKSLHNNILDKVVHQTMTFFSHHSSGRILNRFSKDIGTIDDFVPLNLMNMLILFFTIVGSVVVIVIMNYWMIVPTVVLFVLVFLFALVFKPTNRNIKRTEGISKCPRLCFLLVYDHVSAKSSVFAHVSASIQGLPTVRASNAKKILIQEFDNHQDLHTSAYYMFTATFTAFGFWTDVICGIYCGLVIFSFLLLDFGKFWTN
jgi:ATP-binding cassette subfamily C (CFTR/MRP) protein 4